MRLVSRAQTITMGLTKGEVQHPDPPSHIPGERMEGPSLGGLREEVAALLGAQPVSFARRHLQELQTRDYYVCEKSDGIRCLIYKTREDNREISYLIDRKNDYYRNTEAHLPRPENRNDWFVQTILDGELVNDREPDGNIQLRYIVFDCLVLNGTDLRQRTLDKRIAYFRSNIYEPYMNFFKRLPREEQYQPFMVALKDMQFGDAIDLMVTQILPSLKHGNDGLIFTCVGTPYQHGTDPHILKWKTAEENSIDFKLRLRIPLYYPTIEESAEGNTEPWPDYHIIPELALYVIGDGGTNIEYGKMHVSEAEWELLKALNQPLDDRIVECFQDEEKRWKYMRFRGDKKGPNHISTVDSVIESINDRVSVEDLSRAAPAIRGARKRRQVQPQGAPAGLAV